MAGRPKRREHRSAAAGTSETEAEAAHLLSARVSPARARDAVSQRLTALQSAAGEAYLCAPEPGRELTQARAVRDVLMARIEESALAGDIESMGRWTLVYERISQRVVDLEEGALAAVPLTINGFDCRRLEFYHPDSPEPVRQQ